MKQNNKYISSIVSLYGDTDNIKKDINTLNDIISRQGDLLLLDVIAENAGQAAIKFNMSIDERNRLVNTILHHLNNALGERV